MTLRARDCLQLIALGREWYGSGKLCLGVPALVGHVSCSVRLVVVHERLPRQLQVLTLRETVRGGGLPAFLMGQGSSGTTEAVQRTLKVCTSVWTLHITCCSCTPVAYSLLTYILIIMLFWNTWQFLQGMRWYTVECVVCQVYSVGILLSVLCARCIVLVYC